jgi:tetratricopeptide (TPR) repeat protein
LYYESINLQFGKNKKVNKDLIVIEIESYLKELQPFENKIRSFKFHRNYYNLKMVFHHVQNQYHEVIIYCDKLLDYIETIGFPSIVIKRNTIRQKAEHLVLLNKFDEALVEVEKILSLETEGTSTWINAQKMLLLIYVNKREYIKADQIASELFANQNYTRAVSAYKRQIALIGVYLYIFKLMRIIPGYREDQKSEVKKYMNEYPEFGRDKSSMNIPIIIAQLLEAIVLKREGEVIDRIDALKKYSSRYITKSDSIRSNCFINMLLEVVRNNYHIVAIERHAKKYHTKLLANPKLTSDEAAEVEFIPYEYLWEVITNFLKSRRMQDNKW